MKQLIFLSVLISVLFISCENRLPDNDESLSCMEYWSEVAFSDFCGLSISHFDFNDSPSDICNADQNNTYAFEDRIAIRVYNHFGIEGAKEEHDREFDLARTEPGFIQFDNVGDEAFAVIKTENGFLDTVRMWVIKGQFSLYLEIKGATHNTANNCLDENSLPDFARMLVAPL